LSLILSNLGRLLYEEVERNGLKEKNLDKCLALVKRSLMVDFGEYGI